MKVCLDIARRECLKPIICFTRQGIYFKLSYWKQTICTFTIYSLESFHPKVSTANFLQCVNKLVVNIII